MPKIDIAKIPVDTVCMYPDPFWEPIVGREGVVVPPPGWLAALSRLCRRNGTLLIVDEIFTGFGRTGELFAHQYDDASADLAASMATWSDVA